MTDAETETRVIPTPSLGTLLIYIWKLSRPEFWMVSVFPVYLNHILATEPLFPGLEHWRAFVAKASESGATFHEFGRTLQLSLAAAGPFLLALLVMGPLLWGATLLINDVLDLKGDRANLRKARSPLVQGLVSRGLAHRTAYVFAFGSLLAAYFVNLDFMLMVLGCLVLAWLYSVPPIRLKTRPGMDVAVNAVGIGVFSAVAGWSIGRPMGEFPFPYLPQGLLVAAAIFVPTTLWDAQSDKKVGYLTIATQLGSRKAYLVGWWCWLLCNAGAIMLSWNDWIIPRRMLPILILFCPLMIWQYHAFIGKAKTSPEAVRGMMLCAATFFSVNMVFALMYSGVWV